MTTLSNVAGVCRRRIFRDRCFIYAICDDIGFLTPHTRQLPFLTSSEGSQPWHENQCVSGASSARCDRLLVSLPLLSLIPPLSSTLPPTPPSPNLLSDSSGTKMRQSYRNIQRASIGVRRRMTPLSAQSHALNRAASTFSPEAAPIPAIFDIFDAPARLIDDDSETYLPENFRQPKHYIPSPFCPPSSVPSQSAATSSNTASPVASGSRLISFTPPVILFDGPAHPSRPIIVTTRHRKASSLASAGSLRAYFPPEPIVYDGPSRPRRRGPAAMSKSEVGSLTQVLAAAVTVVAGVLSYQLYGQRFAVGKRPSLKNLSH